MNRIGYALRGIPLLLVLSLPAGVRAQSLVRPVPAVHHSVFHTLRLLRSNDATALTGKASQPVRVTWDVWDPRAELPADTCAEILRLQSHAEVIIDDYANLLSANRKRGFEQVHIRGGRATGTAFMIDGMQVTNLTFGGQAVALPDPSVGGMVIMEGGLSAEFGNTLDIENAVVIGLLPDIDRDKFKFIGNSSLRGARLVSQSAELLYDAELIARNMTNVEFWDNPRFMDHYTASMFLPHTDQDLFPSVTARRERPD